MKRLLIFLSVGVSFGCASTPENPWTDLTTDTKPAAQALECGPMPRPTEVVGESILYDNAGVNALESFRQCAEDNAEIVNLHADQIAELKTARNALVEAGLSQRHIADMREQMLEDERKHNFYTSIGYWVIILALGLSL